MKSVYNTVKSVYYGETFIPRKKRKLTSDKLLPAANHICDAFVSPIKLKAALIVLVGGGAAAQGAIRFSFWMGLFGEFVFHKGFWIILRCTGNYRGGVRANKRSVQYLPVHTTAVPGFP